jgi:hypothetical protein
MKPVMTFLTAATGLIFAIGAVPAFAGEDAPVGNVKDGREYLVPALADDPFSIGEGPRPYERRLSFTPGAGSFGGDRMYSLRVAYSPNSWLGWEAGLEHTPGEAVHAVLHTVGAVGRYPLPWRVQPYARAAYGMMMVFPGNSLKADPVTENALIAGGGIEFFIRDDVALRAEMSLATIIGGDRASDETVAYQYRQTLIALSFYRALGR